MKEYLIITQAYKWFSGRFDAACAFQSLEVEFLSWGAAEAAKRMVKSAMATNPGHRLLILEDPRLEALF